MSETKFGGKSGAHSEKFSLTSEIFPKLAKITVDSENFSIFFIFYFLKNKNKIINK